MLPGLAGVQFLLRTRRLNACQAHCAGFYAQTNEELLAIVNSQHLPLKQRLTSGHCSQATGLGQTSGSGNNGEDERLIKDVGGLRRGALARSTAGAARIETECAGSERTASINAQGR